MKIKSVSKEDLETMSFEDIAYIILKENKDKMKIMDIFQIICDELNLGKNAFENQIGDFFALLSTEKRFIQLEKGYWDLRENHTSEVNISDIEDELDDDIPEDMKDEEVNDNEDKDYYDEIDDVDDDDNDDGLSDLVIIDDSFEDDSNL